ncbi:hypothetical protein ACFWAP_08930 [Streptomyces goshikiensis]|uniref:hypothetical protein n=1 Tax=Streptomyces goshikiensis TaxID=1942 RepID=UPI003651AFDE
MILDVGDPMATFKKPSLEEGPHKQLNDYLHQLHLEAMKPSAGRIAQQWKAGMVAGKYRAARSGSAVHAMFSGTSVPDGEALHELVMVLLTDFPSGSNRRGVEWSQQQVRSYFAEIGKPVDAGSVLLQQLRATGNAYLKLAEAVQQAENLDRRNASVDDRYYAWTDAGDLVRDLLDEDDEARQQIDASWEKATEEFMNDQGP